MLQIMSYLLLCLRVLSLGMRPKKSIVALAFVKTTSTLTGVTASVIMLTMSSVISSSPALVTYFVIWTGSFPWTFENHQISLNDSYLRILSNEAIASHYILAPFSLSISTSLAGRFADERTAFGALYRLAYIISTMSGALIFDLP
jgi:hypothetical protein